MAEGSTRAQYSAEDVIDLVTEDCDYEDDVDEVFFPGSDDEFGLRRKLYTATVMMTLVLTCMKKTEEGLHIKIANNFTEKHAYVILQ